MRYMVRVLIASLLLAFASATFAQATFVSATRIDFNGTASSSGSVTICPGCGLLVAVIGRDSASTAFTSVTYNGSPLTATNTTTAYAQGGIVSYGAAFQGVSGTAQTLAITMNATPVFSHVYAVVYSNPNLVTMIGDDDGAEGFDSPLVVTNTSDASALHVALAYWRQDSATMGTPVLQAGNGQTAIATPFDNANGNVVWASYRSGSAGGTAQSGFTFPNATAPQWVIQSFRLNGVSSGTSPVSKILQQH